MKNAFFYIRIIIVFTIFLCSNYLYSQAWLPVGQDDFNQPSYYEGIGPNIAIDETGQIFVVFSDAEKSFKATVRTNVNGHWETVGTAGFSEAQASDADISISPSGIPYVVYQEYNLSKKATAKRFVGGIWETVGTPNFSAGIATITKIEVSNDNVVYVAYKDWQNGSKITVKKLVNGIWQTVGQAGFSNQIVYDFTLKVDSEGTPYVCYGDNALYVKKFDGNEWISITTPDMESIQSENPDMAFDQDDNIYLAYSDKSHEGKASVKKFDGVSWIDIGQNYFSNPNVSFSEIAIDNNGRPVVMTMSFVPIYYTYQVNVFDGTNWVNIDENSFSQLKGWVADFEVDKAGEKYIAFEDLKFQSKSKVKHLVGGKWTTLGTEGLAQNAGTNSHVFIGNNDVPFAGFLANGRQANVKKFINASWQTVGIENISSGSVNDFKMVMTGSGNPIIAYTSIANGGKATVKKWNGTSWENLGADGFTAGGVGFLSLTIDGNDIPFVAYQDQTLNNKLSVRRFINGVWEYVGPITISQGGANMVAIKANQNGDVFIAYRDQATSTLLSLLKLNGNSWEDISWGMNINLPLDFELEVDQNGILYVIYHDSNNLKFLKMGNNQWNTLPSITNVFDNSFALAFDNLGIPHVLVIQDNVMTKMMKSVGGGAWETVGEVGFTAAYPTYLDLEFNSQNIPYSIYCVKGIYVKKFDTASSIFESNDKHFDSVVYPNPTTGIFYLKGISEIDKIQVYNAQGTWLLESLLNTPNIDELPPGCYYLKIFLKNGKILSNRIIKQ